MSNIVKRTLDLILVAALLVLAVPTMLIVALLNPFLNPGPLFFCQVRVGMNEKLFRMWKLRTMMGEATEARFATSEAHRISGFGRLLRRGRIDEIPQIINVLLGDMSVIGPRPEQPGFYAEFSNRIPRYRERQQIRPGITGLAQVMMGYTDSATGAHAKLQWDLDYLEKQSLKMEFFVITRTFIVLLTGKGSS
ncbi:sugar transferase [Tropicimonas sp. TH_r6]|uniref:sugar transferase n=1 Tax=Tropicimonas sp. TH_r6 TaxID=3082085 RepID=UPI0029550EFC|nr:sugar transferase [Tropicimonas sp. TH_r6]MDV7144298.1 sugar transferase [Tropicimonas sp. TH_r6]